MEIGDPGGQRAAMVKKVLITPLRERWVIALADGPDLEVQGDILDSRVQRRNPQVHSGRALVEGIVQQDGVGARSQHHVPPDCYRVVRMNLCHP